MPRHNRYKLRYNRQSFGVTSVTPIVQCGLLTRWRFSGERGARQRCLALVPLQAWSQSETNGARKRSGNRVLFSQLGCWRRCGGLYDGRGVHFFPLRIHPSPGAKFQGAIWRVTHLAVNEPKSLGVFDPAAALPHPGISLPNPASGKPLGTPTWALRDNFWKGRWWWVGCVQNGFVGPNGISRSSSGPRESGARACGQLGPCHDCSRQQQVRQNS